MSHKLIEELEVPKIVCDNPKCDYEYEFKQKFNVRYLSYFVNVKCPKCGENLLTYSDYVLAVNFDKVINFINKYFGWLSIFAINKKRSSISMKFHNGIKIIKEKKY